MKLTFGKMLLILLELIVFSIQPIPGNLYFEWSITPVGETEPRVAIYRVDIILSYLMVFRLFLFLRSFLLHLRIFDYRFAIIGRLNAVNFDISFKIKYLMSVHPVKVMITINVIYFICASYYMRIVERQAHFKLSVFWELFLNSHLFLVVQSIQKGVLLLYEYHVVDPW